MSRYQDYDLFARIYNEFWGNFPIRMLPVLEQLALNAVPKGARVLDLCCGTGQFAKHLMEQGYEVVGVDGSEQMLSYARQHAPDATFHLADARDFSLASPVDVVFSTFDGLNHILDISELEQVFANIYHSLNAEGRFVFDLNMEQGFRRRWAGEFSIIEDENVIIVKSTYDEEQQLATADITMFYQESGWHRADVSLTQTCYTEDEIKDVLAKVGFVDIEAYDAVSAFDLPQQVGRTFFSAQKPN